MPAVQSLFTGAVLNADARGEPIPTLPFVTSFISATPEREDKSHADSVTGLNLRSIGASQRFVISLDYSHHSGANIAEAEVDSIVRSSALAIATVTTVTAAVDVDTTTDRVHVLPYLFGVGSSSTGRIDYVPGGFSDVSGSDFLIGGIRTVVDHDSDLQKVYVSQWSATNGFGLDDSRICREMLDEFSPTKFFASVRGMDHDKLFTEFNVGAARQISLSAEVRMRAEYNIREKRKLRTVVDEQAELLKVRDGEIESLKAKLLLKEAEAAEALRLWAERERERNELSVKVTDLSASVKVREQEVADLDAQVTAIKLQIDNLVDQVHELEISSVGLQEKVAAYKDFIGQLEKFQDKKIEEVNEKFDKLCVDFVDMALHIEEKFYPRLLTTIFGRRWLLTHGMELAVVRCLNSTEYVSALGTAISKAVEKGMQEGLSAGITHGAEGRKLADVAAYKPSAEADYLPTIQRLQNVNFSLTAELKSNKDASVDTIMNLLCLDDALTERLGLTESQPHANQLMIRENIPSHVSALRGVFVALSEPLSAATLEGGSGVDDETAAVGNIDLFSDHFLRLQIFYVRGRVCQLLSLSLYAPLPNASVTSYSTLKKCTKKSDFQWTPEAEGTFKEIKQSIAKLSMLTALKEKEELISRALQGPEINYTPIEKLILTLVSVSKRLKRYFHAHTIVVIMDQLIKQLLSNPEVTGRLLKWRFELGEHDIQYRPRTSVKGQILVDFIMKRLEDDAPDTPMEDREELPDPWILFTDGSSCIDGSGAGLIITNPEGMEFTYALRFDSSLRISYGMDPP
nr:reverse transcriptase domain-containing protein [Tanacetum cinerariifolium]